MSYNTKNKNEHRKNRMTTYLSDDENTFVRELFNESSIGNFSQYLRHNLLSSLSNKNTTILKIPPVNHSIAESLTESIYSTTRLIAELEADANIHHEESETEKLNLIKNVIIDIKKTAREIHSYLHWFKGDLSNKRAIKDFILLVMSGEEIAELALSVLEKTEDKS
tara:strand:+ start:7984 stop:8481 length:498 start_codon:yes stop_codon:yes gene_type:complete